MAVTLGLVILGFIHAVAVFFPSWCGEHKRKLKALLPAGVMQPLPASEGLVGGCLEWCCFSHVVFFVSVL